MKNRKKLNPFIILMLGILTFNSCADDDMPQIGTSVAPEFMDPEAGNSYILAAEGASNTFEVYTWSNAKWADVQTPALYTLQIALEGTAFANPKTVVTTNSTSIRVLVSEINAAILSMKIKTTDDFELRLIANSINENSEKITGMDTLYSEALSLTVTPYVTLKKIAPLFIVGSLLGNKVWDAGNYSYLMFKNDSETDNTLFTYTTNFKAGEFKLLVALNSWNTAFGYDDNGKIVQMDNGKNLASTAGYQTMTFDTSNGTLTFAPYDASSATTYTSIGLIGAFNGWATDLALTKTDYDPHIWVADNVELTDGELKFRANGAWDVDWGGSQFPYGVATIKGPNLTVDAGTYFVKFNDLTGHYIFYKLD